MDPHMHHLRPSSSALHFKFAVTKKVTEEEETETEEEEEEEEGGRGGGSEGPEVNPQLKKKRMNINVGGSGAINAAGGAGDRGVAAPPAPASCRVEKCNADLSVSKRYHRRHKVCEYHAKAEVAMVDGSKQRFCQQCSRFHELPEFDEAKRSCRRRLAGHNERRRKQFSESRGETSGSRRGSSRGEIKKNQCRDADECGRIPTVFPEDHQNFHIR